MLTLRAPRKAAEYFRSIDPNTAITEAFIRKLIREGEIPVVKNGMKTLVAIEQIEAYLTEQLK